MTDATPSSQFDIFPWDSSFEIGIAIIDKQHRQLVALLNELAHSYIHDGGHDEIERIIDALIDYTGYHFSTEETLWAELPVNDSLFEGHLKAHSIFIDKVRAMQAKLKSDNSYTLMEDLLSFLITWLVHHVLYEDKQFSLVLFKVREGMELDTAKQQASFAMAGQASVLTQRVLSMYKELSSRTLALEREAYSRQAAEQALLDQEQHWSSVLAASSDSLWDWDFSAAGSQHDDQLISVDQFSKNGFRIHPDDWPSLRQDFLAHMLGQKEVFLHQHRVIDAAGNVRWIQSRGKIIEQDSAGRPLRMVGTQTDVTERKTAERTLKRERDTRMLISEFATDFMASSTEGFDAAVNRALQRSCEYMRADRCYVFLISTDGQYINNTHEWCAAGIEPEIDNLQGIPIRELSWWMDQLRNTGCIQIEDILKMPAEAENEYHLLELDNIRSLYAYPLHIDKKLVGFMGSDSVTEQRDWSSESIEFLNLMGDLLGIALGHRELHQKREQAIQQLERAEALAHLGRWRIEYASPVALCSDEVFRIFECDPEQCTLDAETYMAFVHPDDRSSLRDAYMAAKTAQGELHLEHRILLNDMRVKHLEVRGRFDTTGGDSLNMAEGTIQDVTEKVEHRESLQRLAFQDDLTDLPNRRSIEDTLLHEMEYCAHHDCRLVLALLDLDDFRETNDLYGAALGDALLKAVAQRIQRLFNDSAIIARVGGDEFVVLFTRLQPEESYYQRVNRLLTVINTPLSVDGKEITLTASIGVTEYPQPLEVAAEQLLRQAQQALFQAKILGKSRLQKYDVDSEQDARALTDHLQLIAQALRAGEFILYYQPKVNMSSGAVIGVEALLRWQKSTGELIPPGEFLPALHNQPLEIELGDWVIRTALAQMRSWKQQGLDIPISVNVSSLQLFDEKFVDKLSADLKQFADISPSALQLEVLESSMLRDLESVSEVMHRCRQLGVSFALDDFGTGYSSLAYLKHLPAGVLKVDRSFVQDMLKNADDLSIISGVIGMANAFGMRVIAEGVETLEQGDMLLRLGCQQGQGYGIARPMPASEIPEWIQSWTAVPSWLGQKAIERHNLPLLYAEVEHRNWVMELDNWLHGKGDRVLVKDDQLCEIDAWLKENVKNHLNSPAQLSHLLGVHRDLHTLGKKALALHDQGELEAALSLLPQIQQQRDLLLIGLRELTG